jgi:hypothetical protein
LVVSQNPSGGVLACSLRLPSSGWVRVSLFDTNGGRVQTLWDGAREVGTHVLRAELSEDMPRGLYFLRAETAREVVHQKVTFLTR